MQLYRDDHDLGIELLTLAVGRRHAVVRHVLRFDHLWLCEVEAGRVLRFAPLGYGDIYKLFDESERARYVAAGRLLPEDPPGVTEVRVQLGANVTVQAPVRRRVWAAVMPEDTSESDTIEIRWLTATAKLYRADIRASTISEWLGDGSPTRYAPLQRS